MIFLLFIFWLKSAAASLVSYAYLYTTAITLLMVVIQPRGKRHRISEYRQVNTSCTFMQNWVANAMQKPAISSQSNLQN